MPERPDGQINIQDIQAFYDPAEPLQPRPLVAGLLLRERQAIARGFRGLRTNGNCGWVGERQWNGFCEYEGLVQEAVQGRRLICSCSYCPDQFRSAQISDVIERHDLVLRNRSSTDRRRDEGIRRFAGAAASKTGAALIGHNVSAFQEDLDAIEAISAVPTILEVACRTAGLGFGAVARVTTERWVCLAVRDEIGFGLRPGGELKVETTLCHEVRQAHDAVVIDHVANDATYAPHHSPAMYGFQSYISMPIFRRDGRFFGTLCGFDPRPAKLYNSTVIGMFRMFADLIAFHLEARTAPAT
jgi:GAF domain-containing protein